MEDYTPHTLAKALRNQELESEDREFYLDLEDALKKLPWVQRTVLYLYGNDMSPQEAVRVLRLKDNPQRLFNKSLGLLVGILNGNTV